MPLIHRENINPDAVVGIWKINEKEEFFLSKGIPPIGHGHVGKRIQHLAGRYLLSSLAPEVSLEAIIINEAGKPYQPETFFDFSISHSKDLVAALFCKKGRVGLDIQVTDPKIARIVDKMLSAQEQSILETLSLPLEEKLTLAWTIKETIIKWYGKGGVNLKGHLILQQLEWSGSSGLACCQFLKEREEEKNLVIRKAGNAFLAYLID